MTLTMLPQKLVFVDLETTGGSTTFDRIIEVGIVRVEDGKITQTYSTLINPETYLSPDITRLTGITNKDLEDAPTFQQVADDIASLIDDCVFVAHNVRFDYGFLKSEFKRIGTTFSSKHFCTVKLSRQLFPQASHHNLDAIIERFGIACEQRHRAFQDAQVLWEFYQKAQIMVPEDVFLSAVQSAMKRPSLPTQLPKEMLESLPEEPGVYIFYGENGTPLYVGKSKNIRERVLSHFADDIRSSTEMKIAQQITSIETHITAGELGALLLESQLVKQLLPLHNRKLRLKRELVALKKHINEHGYETVTIEPITTINPNDLQHFLGFFNSRKQAKGFLTELCKEHTLCEKLLGLEKTKNACFLYRLDQCHGACTGQEKPLHYNFRFINAFAARKIQQWPFPGPVLIEEKHPFGDHSEYFIVDNWCYRGHIKIDDEGNRKETLMQPVFDLDMYKILMQYLKNKRSNYAVHLLTEAIQQTLAINPKLFSDKQEVIKDSTTSLYP